MISIASIDRFAPNVVFNTSSPISGKVRCWVVTRSGVPVPPDLAREEQAGQEGVEVDRGRLTRLGARFENRDFAPFLYKPAG